MLQRLFLIIPVLLLVSCAYSTEKSIQTVQVVTPGAYDAVCYMYVDGTRYRIRPPQKTTVSNNAENLIVDCLAPGNRRQKVFIEAYVSEGTYANAINAGVGLPWDYLSGAMFKWPEVITVDFTDAQTTPEALPAHNNPDIKQPEDYLLEEFLPDTPRLNSDRFRKPTQIRERQKPEPMSSYSESPIAETGGAGTNSPTKGQQMMDISPDSVGPSVAPEALNPSTGSAVTEDPGDAPPLPLFHGQ